MLTIKTKINKKHLTKRNVWICCHVRTVYLSFAPRLSIVDIKNHSRPRYPLNQCTNNTINGCHATRYLTLNFWNYEGKRLMVAPHYVKQCQMNRVIEKYFPKIICDHYKFHPFRGEFFSLEITTKINDAIPIIINNIPIKQLTVEEMWFFPS